MDIRFNHLGYLHLLWVVLALAGVVVYGFARKRRALARFASLNLHPALLGGYSPGRQRLRAGLVVGAMIALVAGMIDPRWGVYYQDITRRGIDIMFVLDVSRSMSAEDIAPNRMGRAKQYIADVVDVLGGDRVGLVTFAGKSVLKCPLTINYGAFKMMLDEVDTRSSPRGGSLIGDAVRMAADSFTDKIKQHKAIVVLTDGEDQESFPVEAAEKAFTEKGIRIYTVGLGGTGEGARIPVEKDNNRVFLQYQGQEVWSRMDSSTLEQMAARGGGVCIPAGTRNVDMGQIFLEKMATADTREYETQSIQQYRVQYQWFAGLALLLLLIESCMTDLKMEKSKSQNVRSQNTNVETSKRRNVEMGEAERQNVRRQNAYGRGGLVGVFVVLVLGGGSVVRGAEPTAAELVKKANEAWRGGQYDQALQGYDQAGEKMPLRPEIAFNRGATHYRKQQWDKAESAFMDALATRDPALEAKIKYNLGNCAYSQAVQKREQVQEAAKLLETAINRYRDCLEVDPNYTDARRNIESAQLLMKHMLDQQKQQQQQQKSDQPSSQPESQPSSQPQQQPDSQPESQPSSDQQQQSQSQPADQQQDGQEKDGQSGQEQEKEGKLESASEADQQEDENAEQAKPAQPLQIRLSEEEAEKLLQLIRDKERQRREELNRRLKPVEKPVDKDW